MRYDIITYDQCMYVEYIMLIIRSLCIVGNGWAVSIKDTWAGMRIVTAASTLPTHGLCVKPPCSLGYQTGDGHGHRSP